MLSAIFPWCEAVDSWVALVAPLWARISVWGLGAGIAAMGVYRLTSNQAAISNLKVEMKGLRRRMLDPALDDFGEYSALAKINLVCSLRLLGKTLCPALLSGLPVLLVAAWLHAYHSYELPANQQAVRATLVPSVPNLDVVPSDLARHEGDAVSILPPPPDEPTVSFLVDGQPVYSGTPFARPNPMIAKRSWWNLLLSSNAGYIEPAASIEEIHFEFPRKRVVDVLPSWAAGWEVPYFGLVMIAALGTKFLFRLE